MDYYNLIKENSVVTKVLIWKCEDDDYNGVQCRCELTFDNGRSGISYMIRDCELDDDKYIKGIYQYKDGKYIQIEDWEN